MVDRVPFIADIRKVIKKNLLHIQASNQQKEVEREISIFNNKFDERIGDGFPNCWDQIGELLSWEAYEKMLSNLKIRTYIIHESS